MVKIPHNFKPRSYQLPFMRAMDQGIKRACLVWHRRCGKDKTALNFMINSMFKRIGTYFYLFPTLKQSRKVIWDGMDFSGFKFMNHFPKEIITRKREDDMRVEIANGSIFQLIGSDNFDAVMGTNPVGLILSEYSLQDPRAWNFLKPILRENKGWAVFLYTPRGKNHGYHLYQKTKRLPDTWFSQILTVNDTFKPDGTPVLTPADIQAERDEGTEEDMIQQEYYCSFEGGMAGAIYGRLMTDVRAEGRVCEVPHDPRIPVYTFWDIGISDSTTIWFMQFPGGDKVDVIRYYQNQGEGIEFYLQLLSKLMVEEGYNYGEHFGPHDMSNREFGTGKSPETIANELNYRFTIVERTKNIQYGIGNVRQWLPRCRFDAVNCELGIDALESYHKEWDAKWKRYSDTPARNWACHGADGFRTFAEGMVFKSSGGMTEAQAQRLHDENVPGAGGGSGPLDTDDFFEEDFEVMF